MKPMQPFDTITVSQVWAWIVGVIAVLISVDKAVDIWHKWRKSSPDGKQDEKLKEIEARVTAIEQGFAKHDSYFRADKARLDTIEEGNRVTQEALLALLSHAIDGNDVEACKKAKTDLNAFLINRNHN